MGYGASNFPKGSADNILVVSGGGSGGSGSSAQMMQQNMMGNVPNQKYPYA